MEKRVKHVVSSLGVDIDDKRMIGIKGIGGGGKTTLAKAVFDQIYHLYEGSSFVENVRESTKVCSLKLLQKQVISAVLNDPHLDVGGAPDLKMMMQKNLKCRKVLIVLDDVDHIDQLEALVGDLNWFGPGSRVIVTTRDKQVLDAQGVPNNCIIDVSLLSFEEAKRLFNRYAFGREISNHGFETLSDQFVNYAGGLPLTIKVLGSLLRGKDKLEWTDELERLKTIPLMETLKVLELSYNSLEEDHKEIFLDVACILKGWQKEKAIRSLESRGYHARSGLKVLEQKSLLAVSDGGYLSMHDHIEEMGKNIVRRLYPNEPCKHSRLWIKEEVMDILIKEKGTEATRCVSVWRVNPLIVMKGLRKMKELRILQVEEGLYNNYGWLQYGLDDEFNEISEDSLYLPNSLQYISWNCYPLTCLPESFQANNLVGLEMHNSKMYRLWNDGEKKHPEKLRFISLNGCELRALDIGLFLNLEKLILQECRNFVEFRMPVKNFKLKFLSLCNCKLTTLDLALARNLETLTVEQCQDLIELHLPLESLHLKDLHIKVCSKLKTLNLTRAQNVETLNVVTCENLVKLHMHTEMLKLKYIILLDCSKLKALNVTGARNLEVLDVIKCEDLVDFHMPVEMLKLEHLTVFRCSKVKTLNLMGTRNLEVLEVIACEDLDVLHMPIETPKLKHVMLLRCFKLKTLSLAKSPNLKVLDVINSKKLKTLYLGASPYLKRLVLRHCYNLVEIHTPIKELDDCLQIDFIGCVRFNPSLFNKGYPMVLAELHLITRSLSTECELHLDSNLHELEFECIYKEPPPGNRKKFIYVNLCTCTNLASFLGSTYALQCLRKLTFEGSFQDVPIEPNQLQCLKELSLLSTYIKYLPDSIFMLKHLEVLRLKSGSLLELPKDLVKLECLEELHLENCVSLRDIPDNILEMKSLKRFHLTNCSTVKTLNLTQALNVERLCLKQCEELEELHLPAENFELQYLYLYNSKLKTLDLARALNLITLDINNCKNLAELHMPVEIVKLESISLYNSKLETLDLAGAQNLTTLDIENCKNLVELHMPVRIVKLEFLTLHDSKLKTLGLAGAHNLKTLSLNRCEDLEELHMPVEIGELRSLDLCNSKLKILDLVGAPNLQKLKVEYCEDMAELHMSTENLVSLGLQYCSKLKTLSLTQAQNLYSLDLTECEKLEELHMPVGNVKLESLNLKHSNLKTLDLAEAQNLIKLDFENCKSLVELHMPVGNAKLQFLDLCHSKLKTLDLARSQNLISLNVEKCDEMVELHMPFVIRCLQDINLQYCSKLKVLDLTRAQNLHSLDLTECEELEELHMPVENFELKFLNLKHSKLKTLDLVGARNLEALTIEMCQDMVELHMPVDSLKLKSLSLQYCSKLKTLNITRAQNLHCLDLIECEELEELHLPFENFELKYLNLKHSKLKKTLDLMGNLKVLQLKSCPLLEQYPRILAD